MICLNCGGFIGESGKAYGYAGKWCGCPTDPQRQYQRPANLEGTQHPRCDCHDCTQFRAANTPFYKPEKK